MSAVTVSRHRAAEGDALPMDTDPISDVMDLRTEVRNTHQRIDALRDKMDQNTAFLIHRMDGMQAELRGEIAASTAELRKDNSALRSEMTASMGELRKGIEGVNKSLGAATIWAMTLCYGLVAAILIVIARGFKWI